jgi:hypothetical protein
LTGFHEAASPEGMPQRIEMSGWFSLYGRCAGLDGTQLGDIARSAGVHLYAEPPIHVMAAEDIVAVHVREPGIRQLNLPGPGSWRDVIGEKEIVDGKCEFDERGVVILISEGGSGAIS